MASFIYFLPRVEGDAVERLRTLGFSHVMERGTPAISQQQGPCGEGFLVTPAATNPARPLFLPEQQTWKPFAGGEIWVGYEIGSPPGPKDLVRKNACGGYVLELSDGNTYLVPAARFFPATEELSEAGDRLEKHVLPEYVEISRECEQLFDRVNGLGGIQGLTDVEQFRMAARALGINYCVGPWEVSALQLLTAETRQAAINMLLDFPKFDEVRKELEKNEDAETPNGVDSTSGVEV